jgi:hypothetical protein
MKKLLLIVFSVAMIAGVYAEHPHRKMSSDEINQRQADRQREATQRGHENALRFQDRAAMQLLEASMKDRISNSLVDYYSLLVNSTENPLFIRARGGLKFRIFVKGGVLCSFGDDNQFIFLSADEFENYEEAIVGQYVPQNAKELRCDHTKIKFSKSQSKCNTCNYSVNEKYVYYNGWRLYRNGNCHIGNIRIPVYSFSKPKNEIKNIEIKSTKTQK